MSLGKARHSLLQRLQRRHQREREGCFVVEGVRGVRAALQAGAPARFAVTSPRLEDLDPGGEIRLLAATAGIEVTEIDDTELAGLAGTVNPQGVLLVCEEPKAILQTLTAALAALTNGAAQIPAAGGPGEAKSSIPATKTPAPGVTTRAAILIADAVQDPANLGTMIRTSAALGLAAVIALDGSVDPWNAKVVRGSAGACFDLPIVRARCGEALVWLAEKEVRLLAAAANGRDVREAATARPAGAWALAVGNEGAGLREEILAAAAERVAVPIAARVDSLNAAVAAAILLWELLRGETT